MNITLRNIVLTDSELEHFKDLLSECCYNIFSIYYTESENVFSIVDNENDKHSCLFDLNKDYKRVLRSVWKEDKKLFFAILSILNKDDGADWDAVNSIQLVSIIMYNEEIY